MESSVEKPATQTENRDQGEELKCDFEGCSKVYKTAKQLGRHRRDAHNIFAGKASVDCGQCGQAFASVKLFVSHVQKEHNPEVKIEKFECSKYDFKKWKRAFENKHTLRLRGGARKSGTKSNTFWECHRSGTFKSTGKGLRKTRTQGSCKSGQHCTVFVSTIEDLETEKITVEYCGIHSGHEASFPPQRLGPSPKRKIAAKLQIGVTPNAVLDSVRETVEDHLKREHFINKQAIRNIRRRLNSGSIRKSSDNQQSVLMWTDELNASTSHQPTWQNQNVHSSSEDIGECTKRKPAVCVVFSNQAKYAPHHMLSRRRQSCNSGLLRDSLAGPGASQK
ncbi:hypothetical protein BSKO_07220 [Bryopsis sp. KO-2023]|nr:hypothetical protein BSKO_07220 [Bryopsis sp. KO-2023]